MNHLEIFNRTIVALVTAPINQNIAIIRISGPETYKIISQVFSKEMPSTNERRREVFLGKIIKDGEVIDEVLLCCFYSPFSFTGEDTVEINCHGNLIIVNQILELLMSKGGQMATAGEFSKKAFFNNKLSLTQATAINDLIRASSFSAVRLAIENLDSKRQLALEGLTEKLLTIIAKVEVNIDYPEYEDIGKITVDNLRESVDQLAAEVKSLNANCKRAKLLKEGLRIGIFGKTNVGKSTLLNTLVKEEKAIVTPIAGTTRDVIEAEYEIGGLPVRFFDTAGVRKTRNEIERKGIEKTHKLAENLDLSLLVVDISKK